jgi:hypothetical protein
MRPLPQNSCPECGNTTEGIAFYCDFCATTNADYHAMRTEREKSSPPKRWKVEEYIREEVKRQGHNLKVFEDGGYRVRWMTDAWKWAQERSKTEPFPSRLDMEEIGKRVEPELNCNGFRRAGETCGLAICPSSEDVPLLTARLRESEELDPIEWYRRFQLIHPLREGNGRTGKILLAWITDSFDAPFFPPHDLLGGWLPNP